MLVLEVAAAAATEAGEGVHRVIRVQGSKLGVEFTVYHPFNHHEHKPEYATPFQHPTLKTITLPGTWTR